MGIFDNSKELLENYINICSSLNNTIRCIYDNDIEYYDENFNILIDKINHRLELLEVNNISCTPIPIEETLSYSILLEFHSSIISLIVAGVTGTRVAKKLILGLQQKLKQ